MKRRKGVDSCGGVNYFFAAMNWKKITHVLHTFRIQRASNCIKNRKLIQNNNPVSLPELNIYSLMKLNRL